jgi:hypothetical protein
MHLLLEAVHVMLVGCQVQLVLHSKLLRRYEQAEALRLGGGLQSMRVAVMLRLYRQHCFHIPLFVRNK